MDSALQQDYLKSLGIVQYVPREWAVAASESSERERIGSESRTIQILKFCLLRQIFLWLQFPM